jgi:hypothetical protein
MSMFEALSLVVACLAMIVSLNVWSGQRRLQRESNELQRVTAELSKRQLELIERDETIRNTAELSVDIHRHGNGHRLVLRNIGQAEAKDVELQPLGEGIEDSLIDRDEVQAKFPVKRLRPSEEISLMAFMYLGSPLMFCIRLRWTHPDGRTQEEELAVGL